MNVNHHLTPDIIAAYSSGDLDEAYALVVACHLSLCDQCRADAMAYDALGGTVIEDMPEAEISDDALEATLRLIEGAPPEPEPIRPKVGSMLPAPLQAYAGADVSDISWRSLGGGVKQKLLKCGGESTARLLYIPGGKSVPDHGHRGLELTLVLQGSFSDHTARYARGDVEIGTEDLDHQPVADPGQDCICLAATDAPLRFNSLIPKLIQPFARI